MEGKGNNGQYRMLSPVYGCKRYDPMQNRAKAVLPTHIGVDILFFLMNQHENANEPIETSYEEDNKRHPSQRTAYKVIKTVHFSTLAFSY